MYIYLNEHIVEIGNLKYFADRVNDFSGYAANGITFTMKKLKTGDLGFLDGNQDVIWRLHLTVQGGGNSVYNSGSLTLKFDARMSAGTHNEALGIDNIKFVANYGCANTKQVYHEDFQGSNALSGWRDGKLDVSSQGRFTKFLGRYANDDLEPRKTWDVPSDSDTIAISFDFYEIGKCMRNRLVYIASLFCSSR